MCAALSSAYRRDPHTGVWRRAQRAPFSYSDGDEAERYLLEVMTREDDRSCASDTLPGRIRDWPSEYHLSPQRYNLLRPLRLGPDTRVLEIGAGCGALTRWLGETGAQVLALEGSDRRAEITAARCRDLPNVTVCAEDFQHFEGGGRFDLVTLVGVLEYAPAIFGGGDAVQRCLALARARLADGGTLALAIENRLGLKYFNGCSEDHTGRPFDSINDLYPPGACRTFGRRELVGELHAAGFSRIDELYPFPDYKLPRCLVRGTALSEDGFDVGQIIAQYPARDYTGKGFRLFNEALAWRTAAANGLVPDLANSFLLLAGGAGAAPLEDDWQLSVFATDRRACFRTQTRFLRTAAGGIEVRKQRLHADHAAPPGPLRFRELPVQDYAAGPRLSDGLPALTFHPDAYARYLAYLQRYLDALRARAGVGAGTDAEVSGELVDCIPPNLVCGTDGTLRHIDAEWVLDRPLSVAYMAYRAVMHDLSRVGAFGSRFLFAGCGDTRSFVDRVLGHAGFAVPATARDGWLALEADILEQVNVPQPGGAAAIREMLRRQLDTPPARLLSVVMDPAELARVLRDHHFGLDPDAPAAAD